MAKAKAKKIRGLKDVAEAQGNGQVVAYIVGWSLRQAVGSYDYLETVARELDLDKYLPAPPSYEARLKRALAQVKRAHGVTFRRMPQNPKAAGWTTYRPVKVTDKTRRNVAEAFQADQALATGKGVAIQRTLGGLSLEDQDSPLLQAVQEAYEATAGQYSHETVSGWLHRVMERQFNAAPFPATGGAHVVPAEEGTGSKLEALQAAVQSIGLSTFDFEAFRQQTALAQHAAQGLLGAQWSVMVEELEGFLSKLLEGDLTHPTGFTAKLAQAEALRQRLGLYGRILDRDRAQMEGALESLDTATRTLLTATTEARALRKAKGSETASRLARQAVEAATTEARAHLEEARQAWAPVEQEDAEGE